MDAREIEIRVPRRPPRLENTATTRLVLERLDARHRAELERLHADPRVMATLGGPKSASETGEILDASQAHWERHGFGLWALRLRADGRFVGRGGIRHVELESRDVVELAYALHAEHWGRGLATELAEAGLCAGFEGLGLAEIVAFTLPRNRASRRVMERSGFAYQRAVTHRGLPHVLYRITAAERGEPHYVVRRARDEEIPALGAIERAASLLFAGGGLAEGVFADVTSEADFREARSREALWVAIGPGGRPVGFALADEEDDCAHLDELDVHPAHGRRGLGAALVRAVCEGARRQGFPAVTLTTFRELPWNAPFYRGLGFRVLDPAEYGPALAELVGKEDAAGLDASRRVVMRLDF